MPGTSQSHISESRDTELLFHLAGNFRAQALLLGTEFACRIDGRKIFRFKYLADFEGDAGAERCPLHPIDRFLLGLGLDQPESRDHLLGFGERAVGDGDLASAEPEPRT